MERELAVISFGPVYAMLGVASTAGNAYGFRRMFGSVAGARVGGRERFLPERPEARFLHILIEGGVAQKLLDFGARIGADRCALLGVGHRAKAVTAAIPKGVSAFGDINFVERVGGRRDRFSM